MQSEMSLSPQSGCRLAWLAALGAVALAPACATGVDVTDEELAEICALTGNDCDGASNGGSANGGSGAVTGNVGGSGFGQGGSNGGSTSNNGGTTFGTGGTGFGTGGTGFGTGGTTSNNPPPPLALGDCMPDGEDQVVVIYSDRSMGAANQASFVLAVQNNGASFNLPELTMRYWFTDDGVAEFTGCSDCGNIDYASQSGGQGLSGVTVVFGEEFGSNYGEITFGSGGPVGPEGVETVQVRIHASGYQPLTQTNDFSFSAGADEAPNRNITPYINGTQVGGCVPIPP